MEQNQKNTVKQTSQRVLPGGESLLDGWPAAEPYFSAIDAAADVLSGNESKGIAQFGRRIGRFIRFNRTRLAHLFEGLEDKARTAFAVLPYLLRQ